jgi:carbohydrate-selective porin OprB
MKPDLRYIVNPSGDEDTEDVLVGSVRMDVVF